MTVKKENEIKVPKDLLLALKTSANIQAAWNDITPVARRDFITWIESAKQLETRARRIQIACDKLASGKRRPCCYAVVQMHLYKALGNNPQAKETWGTLRPLEKRDISAWVEEAETKSERDIRIEKACTMLASGKKNVQ